MLIMKWIKAVCWLSAIFMFNTFQNTRSRAWCVHTSVGSSVALLIARTKHVNCHVVSTCAVFLPQFLVLACCAGALFTAEVLCSWYFQRVTNVQDHCPPALFQFKRSTTTLQVPHWHRVFIIKKKLWPLHDTTWHYMTHTCVFQLVKKTHSVWRSVKACTSHRKLCLLNSVLLCRSTFLPLSPNWS